MAGQTESSTPSSSPQEPLPLFGWPAPAVARDQRTVVNVDGLPMPEVATDTSAAMSNSVWQRLFPPPGGFVPGEGVLNPQGVQIQQYTIEDRLGVGGMGSVFLANDNILQRPVAVKVLSPTYARDPAAVRRFRNEARAAARLDHENITRVFGVGEEQGLHFIAYEYVEGVNLRDLIRDQGRLPLDDAINYMIQLASALAHTAEAGVVHRDIKPSNIIVTPSRRAKLVDLGLARHDWLDQSAELTVAGTTLGTFDYISPEQARDPRSVDVRSDIYSLGCTLYHMLTGEPPYPEGTVFQKLLDHNGGEPPDPAEKNRRVPTVVSAIARKMMASDRRKRYQTPEELLDDLLDVAARLGLQPLPAQSVAWTHPAGLHPRFWEQHVGWIVTLATLVLLAVILEFFPGFSSRSAGSRVTETTSPTTEQFQTGAVDNAEAPQAPIGDADTQRTPAEPSAVQPVPLVVDSAQGRASSRTNTLSPNGVSMNSDGPNSDAVLTGAIAGPDIDWNEFSLAAESLGNLADVPPSPRTTVEVTTGDQPRLFEDSTLTVMTPKFPEVTDRTEPSDDRAKAPAPTGNPVSATLTDGGGDARPALTAPGMEAKSDSPTRQVAVVPQAPAEPTVEASVVLVNGVGYPTLEAACTQAPDGSVIELRFNGSRGVLEKPILITQKSLTVRAARDFRPLIEFDTSLLSGSDAALVTVREGSLTLINLDLAVAATRQLRLFELEQSRALRLQRSTVTMDVGDATGSAVFAVRSKPGSELGPMRMPNAEEVVNELEIEVSESLIRSKATFMVPAGHDSIHCYITDSALILDDALCLQEGIRDEADALLSHEVDLRNSTVIAAKPLLVFRDHGDFSRQLVPLHVSSRNSILAGVGDHPLVDIRGSMDLETLLGLVSWDGERNFYDARTVLMVVGVDGNDDAFSLNFSDWVAHWNDTEMAADNGKIVWAYPHDELDVPRADFVWFALDESSEENPPLAAAADGSNAGVTLSRLPPVPTIRRSSN